jgi:ribosome-binding protein aMBF1 (putative translation factor)
MREARHDYERGKRLEEGGKRGCLAFHEAARGRRAAMRATRRGGCAQNRPQGATEGEAGRGRRGASPFGAKWRRRSATESVAIVASFYPDLYQAALTLLIEAREKAGLSQTELAACFGLPEQLVVSYESGARLLDVGEFVAICRAIGVDPYELLLKSERIAEESTAAEPLIEE